MLRAILSVLFSVLLGCATQAASEAEWRACRSGEPDDRLNACSRIIDAGALSASDRTQALHNRAIAHQAKGLYDRVIADTTAAIRLQPNLAELYWSRGRAHSYKKAYDLAIRDYDQAIKLNPGYASAFNNRAWMYIEKGEADRALNDASEALRLDPSMISAVYLRGLAYERKGNTKQAIEHYRRVLAAPERPGNEGDQIARRLAPERLGALSAAVAAAPRAPQTPAAAPAKLAASATDAIRKACEEASGDKRVEACTRIIANTASTPEHRAAALHNRSGVLYDRRQYEAAIADLDQLLVLQPQNVAAFSRRGYAKAELNRHEAAIADFDKVLSIEPGHATAYNGRGNAHRNRGDFERALADYAAALKREPGYLWPMRNRGYTHERMGFFAEAEQVYRQVLAAPGRPGNTEDRRAKHDAESDLKRIAAVMKARSRVASPIASRVALIIANTKYKGSFDELKTPGNDARALTAALKRVGFKDKDVIERHDLDRKGMIAALREFEAKARGVDWALVFFAGHGVRARSNLDFLIPVDANITSERDLADEAVALERVVERIADAKRLQMVIFDACRSNELTRRLYASADAPRSSAASNAPFEGPGLMLAFSARRGQSAFDGQTHSPFVEALLANLGKPGLDLEAVFTATAEQVKKATKEQQSPEIYGLGYGKGLVLGPTSPAGHR